MDQFGSTFPLLIKFIDARDDLSIQVHPNDELAMKRHNSFGKTEMWYVINAAEGAGLYSGFSQQIDAEEYVKRVGDNTIMDVLQRYEVSPGDVFFLCLRVVFMPSVPDALSQRYSRPATSLTASTTTIVRMPTVTAVNCIPSWPKMPSTIPCLPTTARIIRHIPTRQSNWPTAKYFTTNLLDLDTMMVRDFSELDSFVVYICMEGKASIRDNKGNEIFVHQGQTVLIPADTEVVTISPAPKAKFMETYIG